MRREGEGESEGPPGRIRMGPHMPCAGSLRGESKKTMVGWYVRTPVLATSRQLKMPISGKNHGSKT